MSKFTPGPWERDDYIIFTRDREFDIARVHKTNREANASLIVVAPELYEALKTLAAEEWRDDGDPILEAARIQAREVLAKVEGQA